MALFTHSQAVAAAALLALTALAGCKKDKDTTVAPTAPPASIDATTPLFFPGVRINNTLTNVRGTLVSLRTDLLYLQENSEFLQSVRTEEVRANFYGGALTPFADAGTVSVNGFDLVKGTNNAYRYTAGSGLTSSPLASTASTRWRIGGAGSFAAFDYTQNTPFPSYNGTPFQRVGTLTKRQIVLTKATSETANNLLVRAEDLVLRLGSSVSASDSLHVIITNGTEQVLRRISTQIGLPDGTATTAATEIVVPASALSTLSANPNGTAFLQTVAFRTAYTVQGGKTYAFVKAGIRVTPISIR